MMGVESCGMLMSAVHKEDGEEEAQSHDRERRDSGGREAVIKKIIK